MDTVEENRCLELNDGLRKVRLEPKSGTLLAQVLITCCLRVASEADV